jgi:hypothetical protein
LVLPQILGHLHHEIVESLKSSLIDDYAIHVTRQVAGEPEDFRVAECVSIRAADNTRSPPSDSSSFGPPLATTSLYTGMVLDSRCIVNWKRSASVDDGYYVKLDPLKVGPHTLHIQAVAPGPDPLHPFTVDVTYHLTIVDVLQK